MKRPVVAFGLATVGLALVVFVADRLLLPPIVEGHVELSGEALPTWSGTPSSCGYRGTQLLTKVGPDSSLWLVADAARVELRAVEGGSVVWKGAPTCVDVDLQSDPDSDHGDGSIRYQCPNDPVEIDLTLRRCDREFFLP